MTLPRTREDNDIRNSLVKTATFPLLICALLRDAGTRHAIIPTRGISFHLKYPKLQCARAIKFPLFYRNCPLKIRKGRTLVPFTFTIISPCGQKIRMVKRMITIALGFSLQHLSFDCGKWESCMCICEGFSKAVVCTQDFYYRIQVLLCRPCLYALRSRK